MTAGAVRMVAMTPDHIDALMVHERAMFGTEAWTANGYRSELADTEHRYYLAVEADAPMGTSDVVAGPAGLLAWGGVMVIADTAQIVTVGVIPGARRRGIARLLLDALLVEALRRGAVEALLEVRVDNDAAQALYRGAGFAQVGVRPGYYDGGRIDAAVLRREL